MKALTIKQPWASLIVNGKKTIEVRSWEPWVRKFFIHAGKGIDHSAPCDERESFSLPRGMIIGKAKVYQVKNYSTLEEFEADMDKHLIPCHLYHTLKGERDLFGWELIKVERLAYHRARGAQGFWEWEAPRPKEWDFER